MSLSEVHIRHVSPRSPPVLIMEIQLLPAVSLLPETLSVLVAPEEMLARALNGNLHLQQFVYAVESYPKKVRNLEEGARTSGPNFNTPTVYRIQNPYRSHC